jgi:hypothetical protein
MTSRNSCRWHAPQHRNKILFRKASTNPCLKFEWGRTTRCIDYLGWPFVFSHQIWPKSPQTKLATKGKTKGKISQTCLCCLLCSKDNWTIHASCKSSCNYVIVYWWSAAKIRFEQGVQNAHLILLVSALLPAGWPCVIFPNMLFLYAQGLLGPRPIHKPFLYTQGLLAPRPPTNWRIPSYRLSTTAYWTYQQFHIWRPSPPCACACACARWGRAMSWWQGAHWQQLRSGWGVGGRKQHEAREN